jgi:tetratricopeptide (TPR) repeat protein
MKKKNTYLIIIFLIVASCAAFGRIAGNDFINFDDYEYITENNHIKSGINAESIKWAFTSSVAGNWHPLTMLSHMLDWSFFGANPAGHHLVSLLLHIGAAVFLFLFLNKTTNAIWPSAFAAALFALHPLRVESVAWAAERKDVLSMFFAMACLYSYAFYTKNYKRSRYYLCLILFVLALLSKSILVTLPFVLMLLDYWPLKRWQKALVPLDVTLTNGNKSEDNKFNKRKSAIFSLIWEKVPFILLAVAVSVVNLWVHNKSDLVISMERLPLNVRVINAIISYVSYLEKFFWPVDLAVFYPLDQSFIVQQIFNYRFILIGITIFVIYYAKKWPFLFVGWFWYLGTLIPVIGLVQVAGQAMADRFTYLPSIGLAMMLAWGIPLLFQHEKNRRRILIPASIAVLIVLSILTWWQCGYWKNSIILFGQTLKLTRNNAQAYDNLGVALAGKGKMEEAIDNYNKAIRIAPKEFSLYVNRGAAYASMGHYQMAVHDYTKSIHLEPNNADIYANRGGAYTSMGQFQLAIEDYSKAIYLNPDLVMAYIGRGVDYTHVGRYQLALDDFQKAIRLKPDFPLAYNNRGGVYTALGRYQLAIGDYNEAIRLEPDLTDAYTGRGVAYLSIGEKNSGCRDVQKACEMGQCRVLEWAKSERLCH